jgi:hypothetical protein
MAKQNKKQTTPKTSKEPTDEQLQGNQHDKIIKESLEETMHFMLKTFGNIDVVKSEQLPTDIQQTQERKPDFLKIITDTSGRERIGHIELHVKDEADISYRTFETCAMMKRKKPHLSIYQLIVYMGAKPAENIVTEWSDEQYTYRIKLIQFIQTPVEVFLKAESAAEVVLGVLGDFGGKAPEIVIAQLVEKVIEFAKTDLEELKFLQHLRIFGKLRNFTALINHIMENTVAYFGLKDEDDFMYKKAEAKGQTRLEQNQRFTVVGLLDATNLPDAQIITICGISADLFKSVKKDLAAAPSKIARLKETLSAEKIAQRLNLPLNWVEKQVSQA